MDSSGRRFEDGREAGFKFDPTDQQLVAHHLRRKVLHPENYQWGDFILSIDLYSKEPDQLKAMAPGHAEEACYFFTPRKKKYLHGGRPSRSTKKGYWKAVNGEVSIVDDQMHKIGTKMVLNYYEGEPNRGSKTSWIMHEYRLVDSENKSSVSRGDNYMLDECVLCKVYQRCAYKQKKQSAKGNSEMEEGCKVSNNVCIYVVGSKEVHPPTKRQSIEEPPTTPRDNTSGMLSRIFIPSALEWLQPATLMDEHCELLTSEAETDDLAGQQQSIKMKRLNSTSVLKDYGPLALEPESDGPLALENHHLSSPTTGLLQPVLASSTTLELINSLMASTDRRPTMISNLAADTPNSMVSTMLNSVPQKHQQRCNFISTIGSSVSPAAYAHEWADWMKLVPLEDSVSFEILEELSPRTEAEYETSLGSDLDNEQFTTSWDIDLWSFP